MPNCLEYAISDFCPSCAIGIQDNFNISMASARAPVNCTRCGCVGFIDGRALVSHQKGVYCEETVRKKSRLQGVEDCGEHQSQERHIPEQSTSDWESQNIQVPYAHEGYFENSVPPFDSTHALMHWIRHCHNGSGLSNRDIKNLLNNVLYHKDFELDQVSVRSLKDCVAYDDNIHEEKDKWLEYLVDGKPEDPYPVHLYYKDPVVALTTLFSDTGNLEGFDLGLNEDVELNGVYSTPSTGEWWKFMRNYYNRICQGSVVAPLILYSDQTTLSNNSRVSGYPLVLTLANVSCELRGEKSSHILLGVLPVISARDLPSHQRRLEIFQKCLEKILEPLKRLSHRCVFLFFLILTIILFSLLNTNFALKF
jgi:hypothetical protein